MSRCRALLAALSAPLLCAPLVLGSPAEAKFLGREVAHEKYDRIIAKQEELRRTLGVPVSLETPGPGRNTTGGLLQGNPGVTIAGPGH